MTEEESIFAKKPKAKAPAAPAKPAANAPAPAAAPKTGGKTGLIITIIILAAALIAAGVVLTVVLINQNNGGKKEDDKTSVVEDKKKDDKKDNKKDKKKDDKKSDDNPYITSTDHVRGKRDSKVAVIEYADPQCPGCASVTPILDEIYEEYGDDVAFIYRHYPLSYHKNAEAAVAAIEAAGEQGYFWEMLSAVFANQTDWEYESDKDDLTDAFVGIFEDAVEDGDTKQFEKDLNSNSSDVADKIKADKALGAKDSVSATPTIIVNGKSIRIGGTRDSLKKAIIDEIKENLED